MKKILIIIITLLLIGGGFWYFNYYLNQNDDVTVDLNQGESNYSEEQEMQKEELDSPVFDRYSGRDFVETSIPADEDSTSNTIEDTSRSDEIQYYADKPVGYSDPTYSNIVGYDNTVGITMSIPQGVVPSLIDDGSLQEVSAYRFEDGLSGEYNDVFIIFSCFEAGIPKIEENIPYVDFSQDQEVKHILINGVDYYHMQYDDYFMLSDTKYVGPFDSNWDIFGCGLYMVGKELSEVHISFLQNLRYIENRDKFFENIYNEFNRLYVD